METEVCPGSGGVAKCCNGIILVQSSERAVAVGKLLEDLYTRGTLLGKGAFSSVYRGVLRQPISKADSAEVPGTHYIIG